MRRRRAITGLAVLALAGVLTIAFWPRGPRPCKATFTEVREGMTFEEVCATVGERPWRSRRWPEADPIEDGDDPGAVESLWAARDASLQVLFDVETGRAFCVIVDEYWPDNRPFIGRLRARLGL